MKTVGGHIPFIVLCPKSEELDEVTKVIRADGRFKRIASTEVDPIFEFKTESGTKRLKAVTSGGMGHMKTALKATLEIWMHDPMFIFLLGTAASLDRSKLQLADVIIPRKSIYRSYDKVSEIGQPDYELSIGNPANAEMFHSENVLCADTETVNVSARAQSAIAACSLTDFKLMRGKDLTASIDGEEVNLRDPKIVLDDDIISCGMVVDSVSYRNFLKTASESFSRKATAIDMESFGFYEALAVAKTIPYDSRAEGIMIRGISDYAGRKSQNEARPADWKAASVKNAATVFISVLCEIAEYVESDNKKW